MVMFNPTRWLKPSCMSALMAAGFLLVAPRAYAEPCGPNGECQPGFECQSFSGMSCPTAAPCPEGDEECFKRQASLECMAIDVRECVPKECQADTDCADGMVCFTEEFQQCSGGGSPSRECVDGPEGIECKTIESEPATCETVKRSACVPRYIPPCRQDSDCGPGFRCKEHVATSCTASGSGGSGAEPYPPPPDSGDYAGAPAADAGSADFAPEPLPEQEQDPLPEMRLEPTCTTEPTGRFYCELQRVVCDDVSDCPSGFTCEGETRDYACAAPAPAPAPAESGSGGSGAEANITPDAGTAGEPGSDDAERTASVDAGVPSGDAYPTDCKPLVVERVCRPPFYANDGLDGRDTSGESGSAQQPLPSTGAPTSDKGTVSGGDLGAEETNEPKPVLNCSAGTLGASQGGTLGLLALVGLALVVRRRRARS